MSTANRIAAITYVKGLEEINEVLRVSMRESYANIKENRKTIASSQRVIYQIRDRHEITDTEFNAK